MKNYTATQKALYNHIWKVLMNSANFNGFTPSKVAQTVMALCKTEPQFQGLTRLPDQIMIKSAITQN